jgi:hypothetical protein
MLWHFSRVRAHLLGGIVGALLAGCSLTTAPKLTEANMAAQLAGLEQSLTEEIASQCQFEQTELITNQKLILNLLTTDKPVVARIERGDCPEQEPFSLANKLVLGAVEQLFFIDHQFSTTARVDTGAQTSSLGVYQLKEFERDGKPWLEFTVSEQADAKIWQYPLVRKVKIVQQELKKNRSRPVISIPFSLGDKVYTSEFNLADRSHLKYSVLLGRNFLRDIAVVDISQEFMASKKD